MKLLLLITMVGAFLIALNPVASGVEPSYFQGFEVDDSGWFPNDLAEVVRTPSGDLSSSYNGGSTSVYANAINAATEGYFGRVISAISVESCTLDDLLPLPEQLLCYGPYTFFGLKIPGETYPVAPFPPDGYTTQLDIYLDVPYTTHHPDCSRPGPCTPDTPGTLNPACATDPNGIECEGSRFDWTLGLSKSSDIDEEPGADFLIDAVFSVGTAPSPLGNVTGCTNGWIVTAGYNSFRSGGDTYNTGFDPRCISTSGWYTFKQVFKDDGTGKLEVDFFVLDPSGNVVSCKDQNDDPSTCSWVRKPGIALSEVGCPRYGWLSNEEINDLPIDNTALYIDGCGLTPPTEGSITPTNTTCQMYVDGAYKDLYNLTYVLKGSKINSVAPGVFFYYSYFSGNGGDPVEITQSNTCDPATNDNISILNSQAVLYSAEDCSKLGYLDVDGTTVSDFLPYTGDFIIGVKYDPSSLRGKQKPVPASCTYTFGTSSNSESIDLEKRH